MKNTEIVKKKLKGCGKKFTWAKCEKHICGEDLILPSGTILKRYYLCLTCKSFFSGMQTAIKSELEFLEEFAENLILGKRKKGQHKYNKIDIRERITDCKNALKLIGGGNENTKIQFKNN